MFIIILERAIIMMAEMKKDVISIAKRIWIYAAAFLLCILCYIVLLMLSKTIPISRVWDNVNASYHLLEKEGIYFSDSSYGGTFFDNYTDALWLNTAISQYSENLFVDIIANGYVCPDEATEDNPIEWLGAALNKENEMKEYSRYWSGFQVFYRVLLVFMSLGEIRRFLFILTFCLVCAIIIKIKEDLGYKGVIPFMIACIWGWVLHNGMCLSYFPDIFLMLFNMLMMHYVYTKNTVTQKVNLFFFVMGSVSYFSNYMSFPLITLGMPLIYRVSLKLKDEEDYKLVIKEAFTQSLMWAIAYVATLGMKLALSQIVLSNPIGMKQLKMRLGASYSIKGRIYFTLVFLCNKKFWACCTPGIFLSIIAVAIMKKRKKQISCGGGNYQFTGFGNLSYSVGFYFYQSC